ncbi:MAG: hypothetical protein AB7I30_22500 [Isosphaeraceae bacterium]
MSRILGGLLLLRLGLAVIAVDENQDEPITPAAVYETLVNEFDTATRVYYSMETAGEERTQALARLETLPRRFLELAENNPKDSIALDALVQAVNGELWLENNSSHPGFGTASPEVRALAILRRDHAKSDRLGEACRRVRYGFRKESEAFLRSVLEQNPHREFQALACLRLAQFLNGRLQRLDLIRDRPDMALRYEGLFGRDYLKALQRRDRAEATREIEALFERAARDFGEVRVPYGDTVAEEARSALHEIRHLSVGKPAQEIDGEDQDGLRFKLSDYRGKVVLLYFWSEY